MLPLFSLNLYENEAIVIPDFDCGNCCTYTKQIFHPFEYSQISANADLDYCGGNFIFNPGLLCYLVTDGVESTDNSQTNWLTLGIAARPGEYNFSEYEYHGGKGFGLYLNYWGLQEINSDFTTPQLILTIGQTSDEALKKYVHILDRYNIRSKNTKRKIYDWWRRPMICGWGHQCYMGDLFRQRSSKDRFKDSIVYNLCSQSTYEKLVKEIDKHLLPWGTLTIDARWTIPGSEGDKILDVGRWPYLRDFVDELHARGKKVLIWWGMWDTQGLSPSVCIRYYKELDPENANRPGRFAKFGDVSDGAKVTPDPTLPEFQELIQARLYHLLSPDNGCYDLDGLKIDHVAAAPGLYGLRFPKKSLRLVGIEATKFYQDFLYTSAKRIKKDALIVGQSAHPYFSECTDMLRLGDIYSPTESVLEQMLFRANVVKLADEGWLIDMNNWPIPSIASLLEYAYEQPKHGVPALYYATHIDTTGEQIPKEIFHQIKLIWEHYLKGLE